MGFADGPRTLPVSVFLITRDEAVRLPRTLAALDWADQIVVVDSGSTDATCEIARAAGAEVHHREWTGYGPQKAHAETLCRHDWLLNVDADEVVTPELARSIAALFEAGPPTRGAYRVPILTVYPGNTRPRPFANDYRVVRLYHRAAGRYRDHPLFDRVALADGVQPSPIRGALWHYPIISWGHFVEKENRYTGFQAEAARPRARWRLLLRLPVEMPVAFLRFYLLRRHATGGWKGFVFSLIAAFARTLRIVKLLERAERGASGASRGK